MKEYTNIDKNAVAVIMAGGYGARLWPRSTEKNPKQFVYFGGEGTLIQNTYKRLENVFLRENIYIVTAESMKALMLEQIEGLTEENIIIEPFIKNTAPCLALAAVYLSKKYDSDTLMCVFPSDHVIHNKGEFYDSIDNACVAARELKGIVTIGLQPTRPERSFGYIQFDQNASGLGELYDRGLRFTKNFAEKPDKATAQRFIESGDFLWNSGIYIWRFDTFWDAMDRHWPEDTRSFKILQEHIEKENFEEHVKLTYKQIQSLSIDYALLEKAENVFVIQSQFRWSDLGNWDEKFRLSMKDARNNVIEGEVIPVNSSNCMVYSNERLVGIVGVKDLIVIDTDESLLICRRGHSDEVLEIVDYLRRKNVNKYL